MSPDPTAQIAVLGVEPTYTAREAAVLLGRSYSWLDQRLRAGEFTLPDGTTVQPLRTPGGYRRFTTEMLKDIATSSYRQHWFSMGHLKSTYRELLIAAHRDTGESKIPDCLLMGGSRRWSASIWSNGKLRRHPGNPPCPAESRQQVDPIPTPSDPGHDR